MFRNFIAIIIAFVISFVVLVNPVHAEPISINIFDNSNHHEFDVNRFVKNLDIFN